ncbi:MAG: Yip1 family protein [Planctomycetota bacterium]|nr:Yip1 family protein [Planctomycetota bacterium]
MTESYEAGESFPVEDDLSNPSLDISGSLKETGSETSKEKAALKPSNPWLNIWIRPRATIRAIVAYDPDYKVSLIAGAVGVLTLLDKASDKNLGDKVSVVSVLFIAMIFGPIFNLIRLQIMSGLVSWTGAKIGGQAQSREIRTALAWSEVPNLVSFGIWAVYLGVVGEKMFKDDMVFETDAEVATVQFVLFGGTALATLLGLWSLVIKLKALGEVQGFSAIKALGNLILASLVIIVPLLALFLCLFLPEILK